MGNTIPPITALIADDEEQLRDYLKKRLAEVWPELQICAEAKNGIETVKLIAQKKPAIAFLDIQMPGLTGLEVSQMISEKCLIVFITAHDEFAVQAFENAALDYILKPVTNERLEITMARVRSRLSNPNFAAPNVESIFTQIMNNLPKSGSDSFLKWIRAQHGQDIRLIPVGMYSISRPVKNTRLSIQKQVNILFEHQLKP